MSERQPFRAFSEEVAALELDTLRGGKVASLHRSLRELPGPCDVRVALYGNVTFDLLAPYVDVWAAAEGIHVESRAAPFGQHFQAVLEAPGDFVPDVALLAISPDELGDDALDHVEQWLRLALERTSATLLVCNFARREFRAVGVADANEDHGEQERHLERNLALLRLLKGESRAHLFDLDGVLAREGLRRARDDKLRYLAKMEWSERVLPALAGEFVRHLRALTGRTRKCLVLDCDNTLWGGVVGEDGPLGVKVGPGDPTGEAFADFQRRVKAIQSRGILLAACSKNNAADVDEIFAQRDMPLRREDFAAMEVNWEPKHVNLRRIADTLNIGTDSLVFIDDNPAEISLVQQLMPEVKAVLLPRDPASYPGVIEALTEFEKVRLLDGDRRKTEQYRDESRREEHRVVVGDLTAYLESLQTRITIRPAQAHDAARIRQLFSKTNQFNVTTIRYTPGEIESFLDQVHVVSARDRFGDLGVVGLYRLDGDRIDSFLLSCRAMGRGIETAVMNSIRASRERLHATYTPTKKNMPVARFFDEQGFDVVAEDADGTKHYTLPPDAAPQPCSWIHVTE